jgi:hypothetical protein
MGAQNQPSFLPFALVSKAKSLKINGTFIGRFTSLAHRKHIPVEL